MSEQGLVQMEGMRTALPERATKIPKITRAMLVRGIRLSQLGKAGFTPTHENRLEVLVS